MRIFSAALILGLVLRGPVSASPTPVHASLPEPEDFKVPSLDPTSCAQKLQRLEEKINEFHFDNFTNDELTRLAPTLLENAWQLRLDLHAQLPRMTPECRLQTRALFHEVRDVEDYLAEFAYPQTKVLDPKSLDFQKEAVPILNVDAYPAMLVRDGISVKPFVFHSGDLMLARGVSFVSAIITQVSDNRSHFSHVVTVHVDDKTQTVNTVESYIGSGVEKFDLDFALKNENARLLLLRPRDAELGKRAADVAMVAAEQRLPYDYDMDFRDGQSMSCVEVPVAAFAKASENRITLPTQASQVVLKNPEFLRRLGLRPGKIITPDDLEIDPNFEMILDWKDLRLLRDSRHKDAILSEIVRWLSERHYEFHDNLKSYLAMYVIKPARSTVLWPVIKKWTKAPTIDREVPRQTLGLMILVDQVGQILLQELRRRDQAFFVQHGRPMTNAQLRQALEDFRTRDAEKFTRGETSEFHQLFR
jgi:hypothetical protein